jgi:hypothetical protein
MRVVTVWNQLQHLGYFRHSIHGQFPWASIRSNVILSLKVSIDCQKPRCW